MDENKVTPESNNVDEFDEVDFPERGGGSGGNSDISL